jgi:hypothetical protein
MKPQQNPPNEMVYPRALSYLREYGKDMAYIQTNTTGESLAQFRKRVYGTIRTLTKPGLGTRIIGVVEVYPHIQWAQVWRNLHTAWITEEEHGQYGMVLFTNWYL